MATLVTDEKKDFLALKTDFAALYNTATYFHNHLATLRRFFALHFFLPFVLAGVNLLAK